MVTFETKVYEEEDNQLIGAEVIVYSNSGATIDKIYITNKSDYEALLSQLNNLDETYVLKNSLASEISEMNIRATTLGDSNNEYSASDFAKSSHTHDDRYYTEFEMDNKLDFSSKSIATGITLYYNEYFCVLQIKELYKSDIVKNKHISIGEVSVDFRPGTAVAFPVAWHNAQFIMQTDGTIVLKSFENLSGTYKLYGSAVWKRK